MFDMDAKADELLEIVENMESLLQNIKKGLKAKTINIFADGFEEHLNEAYRGLSFAAPEE